jgi:hypothetical protein
MQLPFRIDTNKTFIIWTAMLHICRQLHAQSRKR